MAPKLKRSRSRSITPTIPQRGDDAEGRPSLPQPPSQRAKKLKLLASHSISSPFPDFPHPTPAEAGQVHALLASTHPDIASSYAHRRASPPEDGRSNSAQTCGQVANVLDSLIGTILSQNTSSKNSTAAKRGLDAAFGRHNFRAIVEARKEDVVEAIKTGGLANKKAGVIQKILREVHERHGAYSLQHLSRVTPSPSSNPNAKAQLKGDGAHDQGQAAALVSDEDAMQELVSYDGVGPKTASCVLLFCLGRASFPVDTHVFRLSRLLGWVPARADRVTAQAHLDLRIPDDLKYGLHVLMVGHGRRCKGCKGTSGGKGECVLKRWLLNQKGAKGEEIGEAAVKAEEDAADVAVDGLTDVKSEVS
ncbi:DNA glycosylase [Ganoderma leucocontextum]|nr:DNA glycosylase [Ganoderma leucocontextum]